MNYESQHILLKPNERLLPSFINLPKELQVKWEFSAAPKNNHRLLVLIMAIQNKGGVSPKQQ